MSSGQILGRAFEYACIVSLKSYLAKNFAQVPVNVDDESSYFRDVEDAFNQISDDEQNRLVKGANAYLPTLTLLEPMLTSGEGTLLLKLQSDSEGQRGDVRDIVISKTENGWVIGLSLKHNHFAVKHSRLSRTIDFAKSWFGTACTQTYWDEISPIFDYLDAHSKTGEKWSELPSKEDDVYVPLLRAFRKEMMTQYSNTPNIPTLLVNYLIGKYDFYKIISIDSERATYIEPFNMRGKLNQRSPETQSVFPLQKIKLPSRIVALEPKVDNTSQKSNTTLELYMDQGWQFTFRIHSASTIVQSSLKFDIQLVGRPANAVVIECPWK